MNRGSLADTARCGHSVKKTQRRPARNIRMTINL